MSGDAQPEETAVTTGRRAEPRARIFLPAHVETLNGRKPAELRTLSRAGAMVAVETLPKIGSDLVLTCGDIETFCSVIWAHDGLCGLKFEEEIAEADVLSARHISDHRPEREALERAADARAWASGEIRGGVGD